MAVILVSGEWSVVSRQRLGRRHDSLLTTHDSLRGHSLRGQSTIEYAALTAILVAALVGMAVYTKRALCGRWRVVGDTFGAGRQYEPGKTVVSVQ